MNIVTASNNQMKKWRKLHQRKYRQKEKLFIAEGERCVHQIIENSVLEIEAVVVDENYTLVGEFSEIDEKAYSVSTQEFEEISDTENPQGILAVCRIPDESTTSALSGKTGILIASDAIQDPGNLGTILRTAVWFGAGGLIAGAGSVDPWHPKVVRSTAGATGMMPILSGNLEPVLEELFEAGWDVVLLDGGRESEKLSKVRRSDKIVLTIGNEANGIDDRLLMKNWKKVRIEGGHEGVESLNASIATGIAMYQLTK